MHESNSGAKASSAALIGYFTANEFGLPSSNIRFKMLHAISASASCDLESRARSRGRRSRKR